jgi:hypothetical protein
MQGELLWFNEARGDGVIRADDGRDVPVLREGFADGRGPVGRCGGTRVSFELASADFRAVSVSYLPAEVVRRARLRGRG